MYQPRPQPEVDLDRILRRIREFFSRIFGKSGGSFGRVLLAAVVLVLVIWMATGFYRVEAGEVGVIRQFGKFSNMTQPGLNWRLPRPITSLVKVNVQRIRTAEIGFDSSAGGAVTRDLPESMMLTTDNSIIEAQMVIQYRVENPKDFVFNVQDPEVVLHTSGEVALRSIVGRTALNDILTAGRSAVEADTRAFLQNLLDTYGTGIQITELKLQAVDPPDQVKDNFQDVVRALEDETRLENLARAYFADKIPRAQGQVQVSVRDAAGYYQAQVEKSRGESNRFLALLEEYRKAPQVTRERLYLETMESVLSTVNKIIVDSNVDILPLLDITKLDTIDQQTSSPIPTPTKP